jgi:hypothetical protein
MHDLIEGVHGGHVRVVAPAQAVPGERWIIDLTAREARARRRLEAWRNMLERHARVLETEIGDPDARLALADAQRDFKPATLLGTMPPADPSPRRPQLPCRRREREQPPVAGALPFAA